jgi:hemoglobin-like flavoprotein
MTLPSQTAPSSLLSPSSYAVVSATAPVVAQHADEITARFYSNMFAAHPELLRVFNQGNQATGEQSKALAGSVVAYAVQLIDPNAPSFAHVMRRIAYKHMSLGVCAEQYIVVGHYLLEAVGQVLGEAVTPEVAAAWEEGLLACRSAHRRGGAALSACGRRSGPAHPPVSNRQDDRGNVRCHLTGVGTRRWPPATRDRARAIRFGVRRLARVFGPDLWAAQGDGV